MAQNAFIKLVLAKYVGEEAELQRLIIKPVVVKEQPCLSFVYRYKTRDITKNFRIGVGYNFTDFSDNLTHFDYDQRGWFLNVVGRY